MVTLGMSQLMIVSMVTLAMSQSRVSSRRRDYQNTSSLHTKKIIRYSHCLFYLIGIIDNKDTKKIIRYSHCLFYLIDSYLVMGPTMNETVSSGKTVKIFEGLNYGSWYLGMLDNMQSRNWLKLATQDAGELIAEKRVSLKNELLNPDFYCTEVLTDAELSKWSTERAVYLKSAVPRKPLDTSSFMWVKDARVKLLMPRVARSCLSY